MKHFAPVRALALVAILALFAAYQIAHPWIARATLMAPDILGPLGGNHTPRRDHGIHVEQLDGVEVPSEDMIIDELKREHDINRIVALGRLAPLDPIIDDIFGRFDPSHIDGIHLRLGETRWGEGYDVAVVLTVDEEYPSESPREIAPENTRQFVYLSDYQVDELAGTSWQQFVSSVASSRELRFEEEAYTFTDEAGNSVTTPIEYYPQVETCGDYPYCLTYYDGDETLGFPFYIEEDRFFYATCVPDSRNNALLRQRSDFDVREDFQLIVVWRSRSTVCYIEESQVPYERTDGGNSMGVFFNAQITAPPDGLVAPQ